MFGRKFLLLKKKIYQLEEDPHNEEKEQELFYSKENKIEEESNSLSIKNQFSNGSIPFNSQTLQTFSFADKNPNCFIGKLYSENGESQNLTNSQINLSQNFSFNNANQNYVSSKNCLTINQNKYTELDKIFEEFSYKNYDSTRNCDRIDEWNISLIHEINFQDQRFSKFKFSFNNVNEKINSVIKKNIFQTEKDFEKLFYPVENNYNKNVIYYSDRFFIYPSSNCLKAYYKKNYFNITNKISLQTNNQIEYSGSIISGFKNRFSSSLLSENVLSFSFIFDEFLDETYLRINEYKQKRSWIENQIQIYEETIEKANKEFHMMEQLKASVAVGLNYGEMHRKKLHEYIHNIKGNIRVYCRVKPCNGSDESIIKYPELPCGYDTISSKEEISVYSLEIKNNKSNINESSIFNFDKVFTELSSQSEIYLEVKPFIQSALDGENVCIFAYGSTGSGKTFTMQGSYNYTKDNSELINEKSGILPRCAEFIFEETNRLALHGRQFKIFFSALEIYNENLFDLLGKFNKDNIMKKDKTSQITNMRQPLTIYSANNDIQIKNLTWVAIENKEDILRFTREASDSRRCDSTQFNSTSSRSHAIFQIKIDSVKDYSSIESSIINIIDLAGSERSSLQNLSAKTKEEIEAVKRIQNEANFINKSLTTLGRIISMIGDKKSAKVAIPYRESKLTMVLQNSLKPNSKTVMIVTVCSDVNNYNMTKESLKFATNAMISC